MSNEANVKLAIEDDLMAETAKKRRVLILPGDKIDLHAKTKTDREMNQLREIFVQYWLNLQGSPLVERRTS